MEMEVLQLGPYSNGMSLSPWEFDAAEFVSEGLRNRQRDYLIKRDEYRSAGVREYWIIDRFERSLTAYRFTRGKTTTKVISEEQTYMTPLLSGFELPLSSLLALMDRWTG